MDFVLCDSKTLAPVLVLELDDASHNAKSRQQRDAFVDRVFQAAGLPILHVKAQGAYDSAELSRAIERLLSITRQPAVDHQVSSQQMGQPESGAVWLRSGRRSKAMRRSVRIDAKAPK